MDRDSSPVFGDSNTIMDRRRKHHQLVLEEIIQFSQRRALDTSETLPLRRGRGEEDKEEEEEGLRKDYN